MLLDRLTKPVVPLNPGGFTVTPDEFRQSLTATDPLAGLTHALAGLWWDAKGNWKRAHESAKQDEGVEGVRGVEVVSSRFPFFMALF